MVLTDNELRQAELYINRDLSLLEFNQRVLEQALNEGTPLLERLRFMCISSTNLDEFFEIRVAGLKQKYEGGSVQAGPDSLAAAEALKAIGIRTHKLVDEQYRVWNDVLTPLLNAQQIFFLKRSEWSTAQKQWLADYFRGEVLPLISPMGLDPAHPFPRILNKSLNFIVELKGKDAFGRSSNMAIVQMPRTLSRVIQLPADICDNAPHNFVFLSSIIHEHVEHLFPGMKITGCFQFRVTRNSDLFVDEEEVDDLLRALEGELPSRRYGDSVRLEVADNCPEHVTGFLLKQFGLNPQDLHQVNGPVNLNRVAAVVDMIDRPDLKYSPFTPSIPRALVGSTNIFETISKKDILLHHPFESFAPVIEFVRQAASDPSVLAIKQTLYRSGPDSAIVDRLVAAAKAGKQVTVVVELRARFDEEANIALANRLQAAGAQVVYGVVGFKTHAKMILVVRREGKHLRNYVHLSTGNYHSRTTRLYTDYGLFTSDKQIGSDVSEVFLQLTSLGKVTKLGKLLEAPFTLHNGLLEKIEREIIHSSKGKQSSIIIKCNALIEPKIIQALYRASEAGVDVQLIVRGMCRLRPGIPAISENITVRSVVGRFLEHTRVFYFRNGGDEEVFCASADLMERNFFRRVEVAFPIEQKAHKERLLRHLSYYLTDNTQTWIMRNDGTYSKLSADNQEAVSVQDLLIHELSDAS